MGIKVFDPVNYVVQGCGFIFGFFFSTWVVDLFRGFMKGENIPIFGGKFLGIIDLDSTIGIILFLAMVLGMITMGRKVAGIIQAVIIGCMIPVVLSLFGVDIVKELLDLIPFLEKLPIGNESLVINGTVEV